MSLLQMSFAGAVMILVILAVRAAGLNRLPKRTFLVLWDIVLVRLLLPFSLPSAISAYSLMKRHAPVMDRAAVLPVGAMTPAAPPQAAVLPAAPAAAAGGDVSVWTALWLAGALTCAAFFLISYLKCRRKFQTALPVTCPYADRWLEAHRLRRTIALRQSDRVAAPLTYGVLRPVILLPKETDWENTEALDYVLEHEFVHIRRFDAVAKLLFTAALCVHWFNPLVWVMGAFANRDLELSCDEAVVRLFGTERRAAYARMLIRFEETKGGFAPLYNSFSKTAVEERIRAVMKLKKASLAAAAAAAVLVVGITAAFATSAVADSGKLHAVPGTDFTQEEYETLFALRYQGYQNMTVADYRARVWQDTDTPETRALLERLWQDETIYALRNSDETAAFLCYTLVPLTAEQWRQRDYEGYVTAEHSGDAAVLEYCVTVTILDADALTVGEYQQARIRAEKGLQDFLQKRTAAELEDEAVMEAAIETAAARLERTCGSDALEVRISWAFSPLSPGGEEPADWQQSWQAVWDETLAPYVPFGLTYHYDAATDGYKMQYQGKEVRGIFDEVQGIWITEHAGNGTYAAGAVELYAVYENGTLVGLRQATAQEQETWTRQREAAGSQDVLAEGEERLYPHGAAADYEALLALNTADCAALPVAAFNAKVLECVNGMDDGSFQGILEDIGREEYPIELSEDERTFLAWTFRLSNTENACMIQGRTTGRPAQDSGFSSERFYKQADDGAWCVFWYQVSYHIADRNGLTVGERDRRLLGFAQAVDTFWKETDLATLLQMEEKDMVTYLKRQAAAYSDGLLTISVEEEQVQFEHMDEDKDGEPRTMGRF